jgi:hypothetical protein
MKKRIAASNNDLIIEEHPFLAKFLSELPEDLKKLILIKKIGEEILHAVPYTLTHWHNSTGWDDKLNHGSNYRNRERMILLIGSDGDIISEVTQDDMRDYIRNSFLYLVNVVFSKKAHGVQVKHTIAQLEKPNNVEFILDIMVIPKKEAMFTLHKLPKGKDMLGRIDELLDEKKKELLDIGD